MNKILIVIALMFPISLLAECGEYQIAYPQKEKIFRNSKFIIEIHFGLYEDYEKLGDENKIYLRSQTHQVELIQEKQFTGPSFVQLIFKPKIPLNPNENYSIFSPSINLEKKSWKTKSNFDIEKPIVTKALTYYESELEYLGCGTHAKSNFSCLINDESDVFVQVEIKEKKGQVTQTLLVNLDTEILKLGKGMCSGHFEFDEKGIYQTRFKVYDICGNTDEIWSIWQDCPNPYSI